MKPTKKDLIALINWAASEAGAIKALHYNDRSQTAFEEAQERANKMQDKLIKAAGYFSLPKKSAWINKDF